jgi:hypothetical protein
MSRIIFVPQYPTSMRYQEFWINEFPKQFTKFGFDVYTLGDEKIKVKRGNTEMFSPINAAIEYECSQIDEYMNLELQCDDILFVADISFPGFFMNVLYHKKPSKVFSFCHATSINKFDYFESVKQYKYSVETSHSQLCDKVFVGSKYHKQKLHWNNTIVTYLPFPPFKTFLYKEKVIDIISASRPTPQKVDLDLEREVEKKFGKIKRMKCDSWEQYYKFLAQSKILLITSHEDTFGYQIVDAILNGCVPIARNSLAYPEILPHEYLYDSKWELIYIIEKILGGDYHYQPPKILCEKQMNNFYKKIVNEMKGII